MIPHRLNSVLFKHILSLICERIIFQNCNLYKYNKICYIFKQTSTLYFFLYIVVIIII